MGRTFLLCHSHVQDIEQRGEAANSELQPGIAQEEVLSQTMTHINYLAI